MSRRDGVPGGAVRRLARSRSACLDAVLEQEKGRTAF